MVLTNRQQFLKKNGLPLDSSLSIATIAKLANVPVAALEEVRNRGVGAYKTNLPSVRLRDFSKDPNPAIGASDRLSKEQWAIARVYSFVNRGKTFKTADADIARKYGIV
jgi:hypothetical protein